jgi:hypothetical protein
MIENVNGRRKTASLRRVALTSLLVASGIGVVGVVPALAANDSSPAPAAFQSDHDRDRGRGHDRVFRDRGDVRYVWYRVCDGTAVGATTTTTTAPETTTETVAQEALAAAVDGAATDTTTMTTETTTAATTTADDSDDDSDDEAYPTFVVVPLPKDEAKAVRKLDERPCYDMTTGAPRVTASTTASTTTTTTDATTDATTTTATTTTETTAPAGTG